MKRLVFKLMQWIKSFFNKKQKSETVFPDLNDNAELSKNEKKKIVKEFNKQNDQKQILNVTVRDKKPTPYDASKNVVFGCVLGKFNVTLKQEFFLNKIKELDYQKDGANGHDVCRLFIEKKYGKIDDSIPERHLKQDHHRSTFKYLTKIGLIKKTKKCYYKANF